MPFACSVCPQTLKQQNILAMEKSGHHGVDQVEVSQSGGYVTPHPLPQYGTAYNENDP